MIGRVQKNEDWTPSRGSAWKAQNHFFWTELYFKRNWSIQIVWCGYLNPLFLSRIASSKEFVFTRLHCFVLSCLQFKCLGSAACQVVPLESKCQVVQSEDSKFCTFYIHNLFSGRQSTNSWASHACSQRSTPTSHWWWSWTARCWLTSCSWASTTSVKLRPRKLSASDRYFGAFFLRQMLFTYNEFTYSELLLTTKLQH